MSDGRGAYEEQAEREHREREVERDREERARCWFMTEESEKDLKR